MVDEGCHRNFLFHLTIESIGHILFLVFCLAVRLGARATARQHYSDNAANGRPTLLSRSTPLPFASPTQTYHQDPDRLAHWAPFLLLVAATSANIFGKAV